MINVRRKTTVEATSVISCLEYSLLSGLTRYGKMAERSKACDSSESLPA